LDYNKEPDEFDPQQMREIIIEKKDKIEKKTMKIIQNKKIFTLNYLRPAKSKVKYSFLNVWN